MNWDSAELVQQANLFAIHGLGSPEVPTISKNVVGKMGLKGVRGLNIVADPPKVGRGGGGGGEGRSAGSGGRGSVGGGEGRSAGNGGRGGGGGRGGRPRGGGRGGSGWGV